MPLAEGVLAGVLATGATSGVSVGYATVRDWFDQEMSIGSEFDKSLAERIDERAEEIDSRGLTNIFHHWEVIADEIDTSGVVFATEEEAVDWLVDEIATHDSVQLDDDERKELQSVLAEEYARVTERFYERVSEDEELRERFAMATGLKTLEVTRAVADGFDRIAGARAYTLYEFPADRAAIVEDLLPGDRIPFVDRSEVPATPDPGRLFVLGPSGSGKTRVVAEFVARLPDDSVSRVIVPEERFMDQSDARELAQQSFDGDVLLVWEDIHRLGVAEESHVVERTLRELDDALSPDHQLYTLLEAQSGRLDALSPTLADDFENDDSVWSDYEPLWLGTLGESSLRELIDDYAREAGVVIPDDAREVLVDRTIDAPSAPQYVKVVVTEVNDELTVDDLEDFPDNVADIWRKRLYPVLRTTAPTEWNVLVAMKMLYDVCVPRYSKLVQAVYLEHLGGELSQFRGAVEQLANRQWLTIVGDDLLATETVFYVHDTQLESIQPSAIDRPAALSDLLLAETTGAVPGMVEWLHCFCAYTFHFEGCVAEAKDQFEAALNADPDFAEGHFGYANLLWEECEKVEDAAAHYQEALTAEPDLAAAHYNYATLLWLELEEPREAADHFEEALERDPKAADINNNYARLLVEELDAPGEAVDHLCVAIDQWLAENEFRSLQMAMESILMLVDICERSDRSEIALDYCERALGLFDDPKLRGVTNLSRLSRESTHPVVERLSSLERRVKEAYAQVSARNPSERVQELYWYGLAALRDHDPEPAAVMLTQAWRLHEEVQDDKQYFALAAGVWCFVLPTARVDGGTVAEAVAAGDVSDSPVVSSIVTTFMTDQDAPGPMQLDRDSFSDDRNRFEYLAWEALAQLARKRSDDE